MQITSQHRLEVLFKRTPYAETFRYIQNFKPKEVRFQDIFYKPDHILYSHMCCKWFSLLETSITNTLLFSISQFFHHKQHQTPKLSEILYTDIVYTVNLDAIPASYHIKYIKELLRLDEQYQ